MRLYEKLQQLRKEHHLSQEQLADLMKVSRQTISKWENGTAVPSTERLHELASIYHIPLSELLSEPKTSTVPTASVPNEKESSNNRFREKDSLLIWKGTVIFLTFLVIGLCFYGYYLNKKISSINVNYHYLPPDNADSIPEEQTLSSDYTFIFQHAVSDSNQFLFQMSAVPKTYKEQDTGEFILTIGSESRTFPAELIDGVYRSECALSPDELSQEQTWFLKISNNGSFQTQKLYEDQKFGEEILPKHEIISTPEVSFKNNTLTLKGELTISIGAAFDTTSSLPVLINYPVTGIVRIRQGEKTLAELPLDLSDTVQAFQQIDQIPTDEDAESGYAYTDCSYLNTPIDLELRIPNRTENVFYEIEFTDTCGIKNTLKSAISF